MENNSLRKMPRIHNGERIVSSADSVGKSRYSHGTELKSVGKSRYSHGTQLNGSIILHHTQKSTQNGLKT